MANESTSNRGARGATGKTGTAGRTGKTGATGKTGKTGKQAVTPAAFLKKADELGKSLDGVRSTMREQTGEIRRANKTVKDATAAALEASKSATRSKRASRIALVGVVLALIAVGGLKLAVDRIIAVRTEGRHTQCVRDNVIRHDAGEAAAKKAQDFIDSTRRFTHAPPAIGARLQAEIDYVNSQRQATLDAYPPRDCSPKGINDYIKHPPPNPITDCKPDGHGLCRSGTQIDGAATTSKP